MTPKRRLTISTLLLIGYAVLVAAVVGLGWFSSANMRRMQTITEDLYVHPFVVSNAAADMKSALVELRNLMLETVFVKGNGDDPERVRNAAELLAARAHADLEVIKVKFLGDMTRVQMLEADLEAWDGARRDIIGAVAAKDYDRARVLVRDVATHPYGRALGQVDYVLGFAKGKARNYVDNAEAHARRIVVETFVLAVGLLLLVVTTALAVFYRVRYLQRELDQRATRDFLTGMPNRRHFMELAEREFVRAARHGTPLALAVVDLDLFKNINDTYGHEVGDHVLKRFCAVTRQALRHLDTLGRVGGEEFAILLPDTRLAAAREVAERVRQAVEAADLTTARGERVAFTGSFGITAYLPGDTDLTALFRRADVALYEAKAGGRNAVRVQAD